MWHIAETLQYQKYMHQKALLASFSLAALPAVVAHRLHYFTRYDRTVSYPLTIDLIVLSSPYSLLTTTTMGEREVMTQGEKKESRATSTTGVENAVTDGCRTSLRLANKHTTESVQIGTNIGDNVSSKLVSVDDSEPESVTSDGDGTPPVVATEKLVPFVMVVRLCLSCKSNGTAFVSHSFRFVLCCASFVFACNTGTKQGGLGD
jgi:hypothetical protein